MDIIRRPGNTSTPESIVQAAAETVPAQVSHCGPEAQEIRLLFFAAQTRNPNTSAAYARADHRLFDCSSSMAASTFGKSGRFASPPGWNPPNARPRARPSNWNSRRSGASSTGGPSARWSRSRRRPRRANRSIPSGTARHRYSPPPGAGASCGRFRWRLSVACGTGRLSLS